LYAQKNREEQISDKINFDI